MNELTMDIVNYLETTHTTLITKECLEVLKEKSNKLDKIMEINPCMMYEIYMKGVNMTGEYQGVWVRFKDIETIVDRFMGGIINE